MTNSQHPFDIATTLTQQDKDLVGQTTPEYANMVGPFGGILAANMLKAAMQHEQCQGEPVALTVNFASPVADGAFIIDAQPVRTNRSTQHWIITLAQNDQIAATATAVFALRRDTWVAADSDCPSAPAAATLTPLPPVPVIPKLFSNYDIRMIRGGITPLPQHESHQQDTSETLLWVRDEPRRPLDFPALAAICDIFFPRIFIRRQRPSAAGTVSLTIHFHGDTQSLLNQGDRELLGHARAHRYHNGYFDQTGEVWSAEGVLLATTMQTVYYKD